MFKIIGCYWPFTVIHILYTVYFSGIDFLGGDGKNFIRSSYFQNVIDYTKVL